MAETEPVPGMRRRGPGPLRVRHACQLALLCLLAMQALRGAAAPPGALASYDLAAPDLQLALPPQLYEVSGVTAMSATELGCVQDEEGVIFIYDLVQRRIAREVRFGPRGDYEGIARAGDRLFVLRSDGIIFEIRDLPGRPAVKILALPLPANDYEGLCHDARRGRLLVAPKNGLGKRTALKETRAVFAVDLGSLALQREPIVLLSVDAIRTFAGQRERMPADRRQAKAAKPGPAVRFMPSAIAVHPLTSELFVVSAIDGVLATFNMAGGVTGYAALDPRRFRQPEGLTFLANGDLVITNEAAGQKPTLLLFKHRSSGADAAPRRIE